MEIIPLFKFFTYGKNFQFSQILFASLKIEDFQFFTALKHFMFGTSKPTVLIAFEIYNFDICKAESLQILR